MDFDACVTAIVNESFWPLLLGALLGTVAAFTYLVVLSRAHARAGRLRQLLLETRRRREAQERLQSSLGYAPRLLQYRRLEAQLFRKLVREGRN